ncbi:MAG: glycosyltransferase family 4 protein [Gammaproteobacteria bacterium]
MSAACAAAPPPRLLFVVTEDWYFRSHRLALACAARAAGYEVHVATRVDRDGGAIREAGIDLHAVPFSRSAHRPWRDVATLVALARIYRHVQPDIVHHVALKPVLLGSLATLVAPRAAVINAIAGLGFVYASPGRFARLLKPIVAAGLRLVLRRPNAITLVQNDDDRAALVAGGLADPGRCAVIRGSGVDLARFAPMRRPQERIPVVALVGRMLRDKGVEEFVEAARRLRARGVRLHFRLVGDPDTENPAAIAHADLQRWHAQGIVEWLGRREDMPAVLAGADIACLPSYREGLPLALLEAAATGLPLVATDVPGCRDVVIDGDNGLCVPPRDPEALANALGRLAADPQLRARMGERSVERARAFALPAIVSQTLALYARVRGVAP